METLFIGKNTIFLPETDSTNSYAIGLLKNVNLPEGTVVHAAAQRAGRGQRGSAWMADPHRNLTASVLLKPSFLAAKNHFILYQIAALSCFDTMAQFLDSSQFDIRIKWPNDILVNGKKIAGILIENTVKGDQILHSILGFGINLNQTEFGNIQDATSCKLLTGDETEPRVVLSRLCSSIEKNYLMLREARLEIIHRRYRSLLYGIGEVLPFEVEGVVRRLLVKGIDPGGLLALQDEHGKIMLSDVKQVRWILPETNAEGRLQNP